MKKIILLLIIGFLTIFSMYGQNTPCLIHFDPMKVPHPDNNDAKKYYIEVTIIKVDGTKAFFTLDYDEEGENEPVDFYQNDIPQKIVCEAWKDKSRKDKFEDEMKVDLNDIEDRALVAKYGKNYRFEAHTKGKDKKPVRATLDFSIKPLKLSAYCSNSYLCRDSRVNFWWNFDDKADFIHISKNNQYVNVISKTQKYCSASEFVSSDADYYHPIILNISSHPIYNNIEKSFISLFFVVELPQILKDYPLDDEKDELFIANSQLHISPNKKGKLFIQSLFKPSEWNKGQIDLDTIDDSGLIPYTFNGPYSLTFSQNNYCPIVRNVFVPEVHYNKVNDSDNEFWFDEDERKAITLLFNYPTSDNENYEFDYTTNNNLVKDKDITEDFLEPKFSKMSLFNPINFNEIIGDLDCKLRSVSFCTNKTLTDIKVNVTSNYGIKQFVPVFIHLEQLKSFPKIEASADIVQPDCNYDFAYLNISDIHGGLGFVEKSTFDPTRYSYKINGGELKELTTNSIELDKSLVDFYIEFFDRNSSLPGHEKRKFKSAKYSVIRPPELKIKESVSHNLLCHNDFTGSIEIKDVQLTYEHDPLEYYWFKNMDADQEDPLPFTESKIDHLSAGTYSVMLSNNGCTNKTSFEITQLDTLLTNIASTTPALCFGYSDGKIETSTQGGTEKYSYSWSNGKTTANIDSLPIGRYYLTVTDSNGCLAYANDTITQPAELINTLTPSYTLCQGSELRIDDGNYEPEQFTHGYEWHLPDNTIIQDRIITIKPDMPQGIYVLKSKDEHCFTYDTTLITFFDNNLPIRFLVPTESYINDTLVIAEDSDNQPDYTWTFAYNPDMFTDITDEMSRNNVSQNLTFLSIDKAGNDIITMYADNGFCKASLSKEVTISPHFRPEYVDYDVDEAGMFSRLQIGPNPNNGEFTLFANLTQESPISLTLYDVSRSRKIPLDYSAYKTLSTHYAIPFRNLGLQTGIYTLLISANGETKQIKFAVE